MSACKACNHRKAGRTPAEARMKLQKEPGEPRVGIYHAFIPYLQHEVGWRKFVPGYDVAAAAAS